MEAVAAIMLPYNTEDPTLYSSPKYIYLCSNWSWWALVTLGPSILTCQKCLELVRGLGVRFGAPWVSKWHSCGQKTRMTIPGPEYLNILSYTHSSRKHYLSAYYSLDTVPTPRNKTVCCSWRNTELDKLSMRAESGLDKVTSESCEISVRMEEVNSELSPQHLTH